MEHTTLTPVFVGLRLALHGLIGGITGIVLVRALINPGPSATGIVATAAVLLVVYLAGALVYRWDGDRRRVLGRVWLIALTASWLALFWCTPEAAYLVFPLFFLHLHLWPSRSGVLAVAALTAVTVVGAGLRFGWNVGVVVGPVLGALVAVLVGWGYRSLAREAAEREALMGELLATQTRLAATERETGMLAERARLAREIHDTVAQGLSSIQMLLHAAERADPQGPGVAHVRLARTTAAANLADTRRFIRELTPPALDDQGLVGALRRLAATQWRTPQLTVRVVAPDADVESAQWPMDVQTALLRIAQGAVGNTLRHADATTVTVEVAEVGGTVQLTVVDDGRGFDVAEQAGRQATGATDAFGLTAIRDRVDQFGGRLDVRSAPGAGTTVAVSLPLAGAGAPAAAAVSDRVIVGSDVPAARS